MGVVGSRVVSIEWGVPGRASVLVDGAFGSTGKGVVAAWLAAQADRIDIATTAAGANSGHTTRYRGERGVALRGDAPSHFVTFHLPTSAVVRECRAYVNAGAIVDVETLARELVDCRVDPATVLVHPRAAVITEAHREAEAHPDASTTRLASTQHGVGAALADKIWRRSPLIQGIDRPTWMRVGTINLNDRLIAGDAVVIETPQGVDLGLNHGLSFPQCTSRDCYVTSSLEYAGVHPHFLGPTAMTVRVMPIRVGNIVNELGEVLGHSGLFYPDSREMDWVTDLPDVIPELTTVTRRVRRIATWSNLQYEHALKLNRPTIVALTFCNYLRSADDFVKHVRRMRQVEWSCGWRVGALQHVYSFSPYTEDVTIGLDAAVSWYERRTPTW